MGKFLFLLYFLLDPAVWRKSTAMGQSTHASEDSLPPESGESSCEVKERPSTKHLVVLIHGIMGTHKELGYVKEALEREFKLALSSADDVSSVSDQFLVHAASSNDHKTLDGIEAGGRRLAIEINELLRNETKHGSVALSILGNSLGGLYARYALAHIDWHPGGGGGSSPEITVHPNVFITTATPHLGIRDMTLLPLPQSLQSAGASYLKESGRDLFQYSDVIHHLCVDPEFLTPLAQFSKRIAFANAFSTDAPVITTTAAFLAESSSSLHSLIETSFGHRHPHRDVGLHVHAPYPAIRFETENTFHENFEHVDDPSKLRHEGGAVNIDQYSKRLDSLGWTKIFVDVRSHIQALWCLHATK
jgi:hypothetical protein